MGLSSTAFKKTATTGYYSAPFFEFGSILAFAADSPYLEEATVNADYGSPNYGKFTDTPRHFRWNRWAAFVQDDWKITARFAVNFGLRWDVFRRSK